MQHTTPHPIPELPPQDGPQPLPPLSPEDSTLLYEFFAADEDAYELARQGRNFLEVLAFTSRPDIAAWVVHARHLRTQHRRELSLATLEELHRTSADPIERRRAATTILRATDPNRAHRPRRQPPPHEPAPHEPAPNEPAPNEPAAQAGGIGHTTADPPPHEAPRPFSHDPDPLRSEPFPPEAGEADDLELDDHDFDDDDLDDDDLDDDLDDHHSDTHDSNKDDLSPHSLDSHAHHSTTHSQAPDNPAEAGHPELNTRAVASPHTHPASPPRPRDAPPRQRA